jgi:hypothetical protein
MAFVRGNGPSFAQDQVRSLPLFLFLIPPNSHH